MLNWILKVILAILMGLFFHVWTPDDRATSTVTTTIPPTTLGGELVPARVLIHEGNPHKIDVHPPQKLDVLMEGDPEDDPEYFQIRCANMGGETELIYYPNERQYICENVDY